MVSSRTWQLMVRNIVTQQYSCRNVERLLQSRVTLGCQILRVAILSERLCWCRAEVHVAWSSPSSETPSVHSQPVSHEVEAAPIGSEGTTVKQTSRRAVSELTLSTLQPGTKYQVRILAQTPWIASLLKRS